jgi:hypothetical protein
MAAMKHVYKSTPEQRIEKRMAARLRKIGYKLVKRGGYAILVYNEVVNAWVEADGMTPVAFSLTLDDVIELTHEYLTEAEREELLDGIREREGFAGPASAPLKVVVNEQPPERIAVRRIVVS